MSKRIEFGELTGRLAFSRQEAAALLGISERHLITEIKRGKLRESCSGKRRLISRRELEHYLSAEGQNDHKSNGCDAAY
jgi:excisionase family DNA binding protein